MLTIENEEVLGKVIAQAIVRIDSNNRINTADKLRWINALAKAAIQIERRGEFMSWDAETEILLIWSDSNEIYEVGKTCSCKAAFNGHPCWHLASKRLNVLYILELDRLELEQLENSKKPAKADHSQVPFLKPNLDKAPERVGTVRI